MGRKMQCNYSLIIISLSKIRNQLRVPPSTQTNKTTELKDLVGT